MPYGRYAGGDCREARGLSHNAEITVCENLDGVGRTGS